MIIRFVNVVLFLGMILDYDKLYEIKYGFMLLVCFLYLIDELGNIYKDFLNKIFWELDFKWYIDFF